MTAGLVSDATVARVVAVLRQLDDPTAALVAERLGLSRRTVHAAMQRAAREGRIGEWDRKTQRREVPRG